ncbi:hypothetical protein [Sphingomonas sp.]|uniref:hypothetical protein n=1 Tax=Sphingomonas sp. TaxID=28214 RepID=UPI000DB0F1E7|nr:hypothetical protein [Sphingomonas sp.]PZU05992.1 MAG: hypothetical protein DI605_20490 [Sphingomonas sp.]
MGAPTATELRATLVTLLAGATDTSPRKWEKAIGAVEMLPIVFNPRSNWRVDVRAGAAEDRAIIERAIALLRNDQPYVRSEPGPGGSTPEPVILIFVGA